MKPLGLTEIEKSQVKRIIKMSFLKFQLKEPQKQCSDEVQTEENDKKKHISTITFCQLSCTVVVADDLGLLL